MLALLLLALLIAPLQAEEPKLDPRMTKVADARKKFLEVNKDYVRQLEFALDNIRVNASTLSFDKEGRACDEVRLRTSMERVVPNTSLFTGVAFSEGDNWRAEVTYVKGILHGPVLVVVDNKVLSQFQYMNGQKIRQAANGWLAIENYEECNYKDDAYTDRIRRRSVPIQPTGAQIPPPPQRRDRVKGN